MGKQPRILTIDIGLTNCKTSLFDMAGKLLDQEARRYPTVTPKPNWSEQDPQDWWLAIRESVRGLTVQGHFETAQIEAIAVTAHMHGMIAIDSHGRHLTNCWTLFDRRSNLEAREIGDILGDKTTYDLTGARLESYTPAAKILWLKKHHPALFNEAVSFVSPKDMVRILLGGDPFTDPIDAAGTLLFDIRKGIWSAEILDAVGLPLTKLPEVRPSSANGGRLSPDAAKQLGLKAGIPLIVGAGDDIEALGAGVIHPGQTLEHIGTTGTMITCLGSPIFDDNQVVELYPHGFPKRYLLGGATNAAGRSLDWARRIIGNIDQDTLQLAHPREDRLVEPPLYLPFISGERGLLWDDRATGAFLGLREIHTPSDLAFAVYQGVAFSMKEFLVANQRLGAEIDKIISGTPPIHAVWSQLRADVYGIPIHFPDTSYPTGLGVALLALQNLKVFPDLAQAVNKCCHLAQRVDPHPEMPSVFEERFEKYCAAIQTCKPLFPRL
jgi:xylulokinase